MGIGRGFQELGRFLDDCERRGEPVERVDVVKVAGADDGGLRAELELTLSVGQDGVASLCDPQVCPDGTVRFALESTTQLVPAADHDVSVEPTGTALEDGDGTATVRFAATVPSTAGSAVNGEGVTISSDDPAVTGDAAGGGVDTGNTPTPATSAADRSGSTGLVSKESADSGQGGTGDGDSDTVGNGTDADEESNVGTSERDVPPFKNPDLLAEVYDSCETFAEMADTLEMDVTAETVRRYMIDYDIHEPNTYQTSDGPAGATADEGQVVLSDGIGLPDEVTADDLIETVERSNTIYEVKQDIDIDRDDALEMLQDLNLLDLVVGRLATEGERDITREDIVDRLREASAVQ
jgi:hypothetical protein